MKAKKNNYSNCISLVLAILFVLDIGITNLSNQVTIVNAKTAIKKSKIDMNFSQIKKANYTSLLGKWKLVGHAYNYYDKEGVFGGIPLLKKIILILDRVILWEIDFYPKGISLISKAGGNKPISMDT